MNLSNEIWILTRALGTTDPIWNEQFTVVGTPEKIRSMFDLSAGVPFGWRLLKNKQARRFLRDAMREELRFQRDRRAREKVGQKLNCDEQHD
jgi:hypothetical protein